MPLVAAVAVLGAESDARNGRQCHEGREVVRRWRHDTRLRRLLSVAPLPHPQEADPSVVAVSVALASRASVSPVSLKDSVPALFICCILARLPD